MACVLSGLAGVYFEKILKNSKVSIWVRNIQLGLFGTFFALITTWLSDWENVREHGFFFGYTHLVWANILIQSAGGLLVAVVIKHADNILKGFATSIAIIVSCMASTYLFGTDINGMFMFGTLLVIASVFLYSYVPTGPTLPKSIVNGSGVGVKSSGVKNSSDQATLLLNEDLAKCKLDLNASSGKSTILSLEIKPS
jgi:UDP-sugar transporter A1/2/3